MISVVCVLTGGSYYSCRSGSGNFNDGNGSSSGSGNGPTFTSSLVMRDLSGVESADFAVGQSIRFDFEIRNRTNRRVRNPNG